MTCEFDQRPLRGAIVARFKLPQNPGALNCTCRQIIAAVTRERVGGWRAPFAVLTSMPGT